MSRYPNTPGAKTDGASADAATQVSGRAAALRAAALAVLAASPGLTADEVADRMGESVLAIRPRISELHKLGEIERSGARRLNRSGLTAHVWRVAVPVWREPVQLSLLDVLPC